MSRSENVILTNMCMVYDEEGRVLVQERVAEDWSGLAFPGGHVEYRESFVESVIREIREETGLTVRHPRLCGVKQWQTEEDERYVVLLFKTKEFSGTLRSSREGAVFWIKREELRHRALAKGFGEMLRIFESEDLNEQYSYRDGEEWRIRLL